MSYERVLNKVSTYLPDFHKNQLRMISEKRKIPMARLIAFAIDNELLKEQPFKFETDLALDKPINSKHELESLKILRYMSELPMEVGMDYLLLMRQDIGIPDRNVFKEAIVNCLISNLIESYKPLPKAYGFQFPEDYLHYKVVGIDHNIRHFKKQQIRNTFRKTRPRKIYFR